MAKTEAIEIEGVRVTSPDKVLYPGDGITKRMLIDYYRAIAPAILAHVGDRPVSLVRCPDGAGSEKNPCFYQRHPGRQHAPALAEVAVPGFEERFLALDGVAGLVTAVQLGTLEFHPWGAQSVDPLTPDRIIFDLDPGEGLGFPDVVAGAHDVREVLAGMGLVSFVKTTGGKGLHVVVPIDGGSTWPEAKTFAKATADGMAERAPDRYLTRIFIAERVGKIFIDYLRNDPTSTAVAPYSTRARPGAHVAVPVEWDEVTDGLDPKTFTIDSVPKRLAERGDPWAGIGDIRQSLPAAS